MKHEMELMDKIMSAVMESEEWQQITNNSPTIQQSYQELSQLLEKSRFFLPRATCLRLEDAAFRLANAYANTAILYGIHVSDIIRMVAANPSELSEYVSERMERGVAV